MIDFIAEIVGGIAEVVMVLLVEPQIDKFREKRKQKRRNEKI